MRIAHESVILASLSVAEDNSYQFVEICNV